MSDKPTWRAQSTPQNIIDELRYIKEFNLGTDQIIYRYKVSGSGENLVSIEDFCKFLGLKPIEGEDEVRKVKRLLDALCRTEPEKRLIGGVQVDDSLPEISTVKQRENELARLRRLIKKLEALEFKEMRDINYLDELSNPPKK